MRMMVWINKEVECPNTTMSIRYPLLPLAPRLLTKSMPASSPTLLTAVLCSSTSEVCIVRSRSGFNNNIIRKMFSGTLTNIDTPRGFSTVYCTGINLLWNINTCLQESSCLFTCNGRVTFPGFPSPSVQVLLLRMSTERHTIRNRFYSM